MDVVRDEGVQEELLDHGVAAACDVHSDLICELGLAVAGLGRDLG